MVIQILINDSDASFAVHVPPAVASWLILAIKAAQVRTTDTRLYAAGTKLVTALTAAVEIDKEGTPNDQ